MYAHCAVLWWLRAPIGPGMPPPRSGRDGQPASIPPHASSRVAVHVQYTTRLAGAACLRGCQAAIWHSCARAHGAVSCACSHPLPPPPPQIAKRQAVVNPENTFYSVKRFIGRRMSEVGEEAKQVPYSVRVGRGVRAPCGSCQAGSWRSGRRGPQWPMHLHAWQHAFSSVPQRARAQAPPLRRAMARWRRGSVCMHPEGPSPPRATPPPLALRLLAALPGVRGQQRQREDQVPQRGQGLCG